MRHGDAMPAAFTIQPATLADAAAIAAIYGHHVRTGTASFEIDPPGVDEMARRIGKTLAAGHPWLVARAADDGTAGSTDDGNVLGYAYAGPFHARPAYRDTCENSIYVRHDRLGQGLGRALLAALLDASAAAGFRQMVALIAGTEPASVALHAAFGFTEIGRLTSVGRKHGQWLDVVYMQRPLGEGDTSAPESEPG